MDTSSDLIWTQYLLYELCFNQSTPIFDPKKSSSFSLLSCSSKLCQALPIPICSESDGCVYVYEYGDFSSTEGLMGTETFSFGVSKKSISVHKIAFGCGLINRGTGYDQGAGIIGLGYGPIDLEIVDYYNYTGLDLCNELPKTRCLVKFPKLGVPLQRYKTGLLRKNYMIEVLSGVACLANGKLR
ncbi:hypothetical protein Ancab_024416 [Ancistrocladus abbreviatus]